MSREDGGEETSEVTDGGRPPNEKPTEKELSNEIPDIPDLDLGPEYKIVKCELTQFSHCDCVEEIRKRSENSTTSRRKLVFGVDKEFFHSDMLSHLNAKQLLSNRKPTLIDSLISRNKTALMAGRKAAVAAKKVVKPKGTKVETDKVNKKRKREDDGGPPVKRVKKEEDMSRDKIKRRLMVKKNRVSDRIGNSLRSGKKRNKDDLLQRKIIRSPLVKESVKKGTNEANKTDSNSNLFSSAKKVKVIRKRKRKVDSMVWVYKKGKKKSSETQNSETKEDAKTEDEPRSEEDNLVLKLEDDDEDLDGLPPTLDGPDAVAEQNDVMPTLEKPEEVQEEVFVTSTEVTELQPPEPPTEGEKKEAEEEKVKPQEVPEEAPDADSTSDISPANAPEDALCDDSACDLSLFLSEDDYQSPQKEKEPNSQEPKNILPDSTQTKEKVEEDPVEPEKVEEDLVEPEKVEEDLVETEKVEEDLVEPEKGEEDLVEPEKGEEDLVEPEKVEEGILEPQAEPEPAEEPSEPEKPPEPQEKEEEMEFEQILTREDILKVETEELSKQRKKIEDSAKSQVEEKVDEPENSLLSPQGVERPEEESVEQRAMKETVLQALGLKSLSAQEEEEKPKKAPSAGYTGTLKAVIKLNKSGDKKSRMVYKRAEDAGDLEYQIRPEPNCAIPLTHLPETYRKPPPSKANSDDGSSPQTVNGGSHSTDESGKASNLVIPEKSSSFSIHPGRLCLDVCSYCGGKFGSLDTPCHIAQIKGEERQKKILENEPTLTAESCLCDACYRHVDRKINSLKNKPKERIRPPTSSVCCVNNCAESATHTVKRKWLLKLKRSITHKLEIDIEKHTGVYYPLCEQHHYWVDYFTVCGICRRRLSRNHLYSLGQETDKLNLMLAEDGIPAHLSDKLFLCKLCRYYSNLRLKYADPHNIPAGSQPFYKDYRKRILRCLDIQVSDSDDEVPSETERKKGKKSDGEKKSNEIVRGIANLLEQPEQPQTRIQVKFGNLNIGTLSNLNIGQGRSEERANYLPGESTLPLTAHLDFQGPTTPDGSWEKCVSTIQFDRRTRKLWDELQRPYGNQSSFLRHLVMMEKYWRSGYLVLSDSVEQKAARYINGVKNRLQAFEGGQHTSAPPPAAPAPVPPPQPPVAPTPPVTVESISKPSPVPQPVVPTPPVPTVKPLPPAVEIIPKSCIKQELIPEIQVTTVKAQPIQRPPQNLIRQTTPPRIALTPSVSMQKRTILVSQQPRPPVSVPPQPSQTSIQSQMRPSKKDSGTMHQKIMDLQVKYKAEMQEKKKAALNRAKSLVRMAIPHSPSPTHSPNSTPPRPPSLPSQQSITVSNNLQMVQSSMVQEKMVVMGPNMPPQPQLVVKPPPPALLKISPSVQATPVSPHFMVSLGGSSGPGTSVRMMVPQSSSQNYAKNLKPILPKLPRALTVTQVASPPPVAITLQHSGITIEKQSGAGPAPTTLAPEKPSISVFREPLPSSSE